MQSNTVVNKPTNYVPYGTNIGFTFGFGFKLYNGLKHETYEKLLERKPKYFSDLGLPIPSNTFNAISKRIILRASFISALSHSILGGMTMFFVNQNKYPDKSSIEYAKEGALAGGVFGFGYKFVPDGIRHANELFFGNQIIRSSDVKNEFIKSRESSYANLLKYSWRFLVYGYNPVGIISLPLIFMDCYEINKYAMRFADERVSFKNTIRKSARAALVFGSMGALVRCGMGFFPHVKNKIDNSKCKIKNSSPIILIRDMNK